MDLLPARRVRHDSVRPIPKALERRVRDHDDVSGAVRSAPRAAFVSLPDSVPASAHS
ncbi:hypothetical protein [Lysobacter gummosus]|uniref:hypothetical protein n=1 Tax=Lysobacter gummosus TaxID=262324 RepID=UPI00363BE85B